MQYLLVVPNTTLLLFYWERLTYLIRIQIWNISIGLPDGFLYPEKVNENEINIYFQSDVAIEHLVFWRLTFSVPYTIE